MTGNSYQAIKWLGNKVIILDQSRLPGEEVYLELASYRSVAAAIKEMKIRGAPAIGVAGAYAIALGASQISAYHVEDFLAQLEVVMNNVAATRPTARNLFTSIERMRHASRTSQNTGQIIKALVNEAQRIHAGESAATEDLSRFGADLIGEGDTVLTHCNTGPLATTGRGTALGIILKAHDTGKKIRVIAGETRPLLQGARLTAWELKKADVPITLITDSMAGYFLHQGSIDCVIIGADRIAANGDTANKVGSYSLAVLAMENGVPFYVAAPLSTIDRSLASGQDIIIEERAPEEVTCCQGSIIAPEGTQAANPAFDITPHHYISALVTEKGIIREPYQETIKETVIMADRNSEQDRSKTG